MPYIPSLKKIVSFSDSSRSNLACEYSVLNLYYFGYSEVTVGDLIKNEANESILEGIRMNRTLETPLSAIKTILKVHKQEELKFTRENLKKVEERLQRALIEFYQKLGHLKNYSFLNTSAVSKIMKKYDKVLSTGFYLSIN